jgi:hypothetical protein
MSRWLYKYIFRGIGWVLLAGLLTNLYLAINYLRHRSPETPAVLEHGRPGDKR